MKEGRKLADELRRWPFLGSRQPLLLLEGRSALLLFSLWEQSLLTSGVVCQIYSVLIPHFSTNASLSPEEQVCLADTVLGSQNCSVKAAEVSGEWNIFQPSYKVLAPLPLWYLSKMDNRMQVFSCLGLVLRCGGVSLCR